MTPIQLSNLAKTAYTYPAIDNHTHPLLKEAFRDTLPFEGIISEASGNVWEVQLLDDVRSAQTQPFRTERFINWRSILVRLSRFRLFFRALTCLRFSSPSPLGSIPLRRL